MASMNLFCRLISFIFLMGLFNSVYAQRILISEPDKEDSRRMDFEIIGKMVKKVKHEYLPDDKMINVDFFTYPDFVYAIYQYQRKNIVHCAAVKLNGMGQKISDPVELDTTS